MSPVTLARHAARLDALVGVWTGRAEHLGVGRIIRIRALAHRDLGHAVVADRVHEGPDGSVERELIIYGCAREPGRYTRQRLSSATGGSDEPALGAWDDENRLVFEEPRPAGSKTRQIRHVYAFDPEGQVFEVVCEGLLGDGGTWVTLARGRYQRS